MSKYVQVKTPPPGYMVVVTSRGSALIQVRNFEINVNNGLEMMDGTSRPKNLRQLELEFESSGSVVEAVSFFGGDTGFEPTQPRRRKLSGPLL